MSIIERMFCGDLYIGDETPLERDKELESELDAAKEKFCENLTEQQKEALDELLELDIRSAVTDMKYFFRRGVQIGFQLAKELNE